MPGTKQIDKVIMMKGSSINQRTSRVSKGIITVVELAQTVRGMSIQTKTTHQTRDYAE